MIYGLSGLGLSTGQKILKKSWNHCRTVILSNPMKSLLHGDFTSFVLYTGFGLNNNKAKQLTLRSTLKRRRD